MFQSSKLSVLSKLATAQWLSAILRLTALRFVDGRFESLVSLFKRVKWSGSMYVDTCPHPAHGIVLVFHRHLLNHSTVDSMSILDVSECTYSFWFELSLTFYTIF
jgi:hypothetical protein